MIVPCEKAVWTVVPAMRRELARVMVEELGLSRRQTSEKLGITEAAISQYLKNKRGYKIILSTHSMKTLKSTAERISRFSDDKKISKEFCSLCHRIRSEALKNV